MLLYVTAIFFCLSTNMQRGWLFKVYSIASLLLLLRCGRVRNFAFLFFAPGFLFLFLFLCYAWEKTGWRRNWQSSLHRFFGIWLWSLLEYQVSQLYLFCVPRCSERRRGSVLVISIISCYDCMKRCRNFYGMNYIGISFDHQLHSIQSEQETITCVQIETTFQILASVSKYTLASFWAADNFRPFKVYTRQM